LHKFVGVIRIAYQEEDWSTVLFPFCFILIDALRCIYIVWLECPFCIFGFMRSRHGWLGGVFVDIWLDNGWRSWFLFSFFRSQIPLGYDENEVDGLLQVGFFTVY
jgi:hypothetical protein